MVNKLRKKFVITAMLSLLLILITMIAVINVINITRMISRTDEMLSTLAENDGEFPMMHDPSDRNPSEKPFFKDNPDGKKGRFEFDRLSRIRSAEMPYQSRYFFVRIDTDEEVTEIDMQHIASVTDDEAISFAQTVHDLGRTKGFYHSYRYLLSKRSDDTELIIFSDFTNSILDAISLLRQSLLVGLFALLAMFILVFLFSGQAVAPVVESLDKQKRFITDAGHELKTPLAIISANVDVLELDYGKSEWTASIKNQTGRLNALIKNLLTLSRMDEEVLRVVYSDFDMSATVRETALSFEALADSKNKSYQMDIESGIFITGDKNAINQLTSLLIDNAIKYASDNGKINVLLTKGRNISLEVSNTCDDIPQGNLDKLFDRFYRADSSRSRESGGYGIGLSVARAIATSHGGKIEALRDGDKMIRFVVTLPLQLPKNLQKLKS